MEYIQQMNALYGEWASELSGEPFYREHVTDDTDFVAEQCAAELSDVVAAHLRRT